MLGKLGRMGLFWGLNMFMVGILVLGMVGMVGMVMLVGDDIIGFWGFIM